MTIGITAVAAAAVVVGIATGSLVSLVSGIAVARLARLDPVITMSLAPKSVTAAIAVEIAPAVDANFFFYGKPIYHAIVVCKPGHGIKTWPQDGKGKRVSFAAFTHGKELTRASRFIEGNMNDLRRWWPRPRVLSG